MIEKDDRVFTLKFNQLVRSWNIMDDKEKLEAIKKVLGKTAIGNNSDDYFEKALVVIWEIIDEKAFQMNDKKKS